MTVHEIYDETKQLSSDERSQLFTMLFDDLAPDPPNTIQSREHLIELLIAGVESGPSVEIGAEYWADLHQYVRDYEPKPR